VTLTWVLVALAVLVAPRSFARPARTDGSRATALVLDLAAAALRSGQPVATAIELAAPAGPPPIARPLDEVAQLLRLGAEPGDAWSGVPRDGPLGELGQVAVRSATSGLRLATAFERLAAELRARATATATARAHRAGVSALGPLAACFLPAFVCLGIVPVVIGVARTAVGVLP
jgi:Flp pilus assembly protein TadB